MGKGLLSNPHVLLDSFHSSNTSDLDSVKDEDIDCSDIPEITDFSGFRPWEDRRMFKPVKVAVTCKLDADIVAWLKQEGKGYQTRLNAVLRQAMAYAR
jgi:uncharacterized protein (DUF4415 family)